MVCSSLGQFCGAFMDTWLREISVTICGCFLFKVDLFLDLELSIKAYIISVVIIVREIEKQIFIYNLIMKLVSSYEQYKHIKYCIRKLGWGVKLSQIVSDTVRHCGEKSRDLLLIASC